MENSLQRMKELVEKLDQAMKTYYQEDRGNHQAIRITTACTTSWSSWKGNQQLTNDPPIRV